jgi:hypothetical protein
VLLCRIDGDGDDDDDDDGVGWMDGWMLACLSTKEPKILWFDVSRLSHVQNDHPKLELNL